jgi:uncharacterized membrane protein
MRRIATLQPSALSRALELAVATPDETAWHRFLSRALALLGAGLILAGTACMVAYNWTRVGRFGKFGVVELAIVVAAIAGWRMLPRLTGQIAIAVAAVLVGPLLVVYGQTYQTGADPYGLFLVWLGLILPWVIVAQFSPLWLFAIGLLDVSVMLYWSQAMEGHFARDALPVAIGAIHVLALVGWEFQRRLTDRYSPPLIAAAGFWALFLSAAKFALDTSSLGIDAAMDTTGLVMLAASIAGVLYFYRRIRPDRFMVTIAVATGLAWIAVALGRVVFHDLKLENSGFIVMALVVLGEIALGLRWYRGSTPTRGS